MSDATDAERQLVTTCIAWDCENKVHPPAVFCPTHAQQAQPGIVEPHLEARAQRAGEAELRRIREEQPLVLDIGEVPDPWRQERLERFGKETPVGWTDGLRGTSPTDPAKEAAKLVRKALKGRYGHALQQLAWALVKTIEDRDNPPHPR